MYEFNPGRYEAMMGLGADPTPQQQIVGERIREEQVVMPGDRRSDIVLLFLLGGLAVGVLALVAIAVAFPFILGAGGAALVAPSGYKKQFAKKGAVYGGLIGIGTNVVVAMLSSVTGRTIYGVGGLVPFAVGLYIGTKEKERLAD